MTLDELALIVCTAQGYRREDVKISDFDAARAVLLAVVDWLYHRNLSATADEERQRLADEMRYYAGTGASNLVMVHMRADDLRRIATLLEEPPRRHGRKSLGQRWAAINGDGSVAYTVGKYDPRPGGECVLCDLVPVAEEEKP